MDILRAISVDEIRRRGSIRDGDVARLRVAYESTAAITIEDAEGLFSIHAATPIQDPAWTSLFLEIITDFIVDQAEPVGYIVADNARWLIGQVSTFGRVETSTEMTLIVNVIERARWTAPSLAAFALDQIRHAVVSGTGPLRAGRDAPAGVITAPEVDMTARIIRAFGAETGLALTRIEAEALLSINRAIAPGGSSPAWSVLLVQTLGSSVLAALGHSVPPRRELVDSISSPANASSIVGMLIGARDPRSELPARHGPATGGCEVWRTARILSSEERALTRLERQRLEIVTNEVIEETDDIWLMDRLAESRPGDENEATLLAYVIREASRLTPELEQFAARRAIAA
jgi:hypothetical protein